jgi:hypothetical protein
VKKPAFEKTADFAHFREVMKRLVAVPKAELDEQVRLDEERSKAAPVRRGPGEGRARLAKKRRARPKR